jgi:hypothetical protein
MTTRFTFDNVAKISVTLKDGKTIAYTDNGINAFQKEMKKMFQPPPPQESLNIRSSANSKYQSGTVGEYNVSSKSISEQIAEMKRSCEERGINL